jgi:hypothetical protein
MSDFLTVGQVAQQLGVPPRVISNMLYNRTLDADRCRIVAGRRCVPADYVPSIAAILRDRGITLVA